MAETKTKPTSADVQNFIDSLESERQRDDSREIIKIMKKASGFEPVMWGGTMIGFGSYHYKYASGHEGDSFLVGFSPRKGKISLYVMGAIMHSHDILKNFGKHKAAKGCVYINKLSDIDTSVLEEMVKGSVENLQKLYPAE